MLLILNNDNVLLSSQDFATCVSLLKTMVTISMNTPRRRYNGLSISKLCGNKCVALSRYQQTLISTYHLSLFYRSVSTRPIQLPEITFPFQTERVTSGYCAGS